MEYRKLRKICTTVIPSITTACCDTVAGYVLNYLLQMCQRRSEGGPGVPVTPLCKPFLRKQPTIFRGENAMTIRFDTV